MNEVRSEIRNAALDSGLLAFVFLFFSLQSFSVSHMFLGVFQAFLSISNIGKAVYRWNLSKRVVNEKTTERNE